MSTNPGQCQTQGCHRTAVQWVRKLGGIGTRRVLHVCTVCADELTTLWGWCRR